MRRLGLALAVTALAVILDREMPVDGYANTFAPSLYSQSVAHAIAGALADCVSSPTSVGTLCSQRDNLSYLLLDARNGAVLASEWANPEQPIPLGSLVKPFTALAYGEKHEFKYPVHFCRGTASGCWLPHGHGRIDLEAAIANSCNSYFRVLTLHMRVSDMQPVVTIFGLQMPEANASSADLIGLGQDWLISPLAVARAYVELSRRPDQPGVHEIFAGMALSGRQGTGREVGRALQHTNVLVKTGTAACTHAKHAPGDGFVLAMLPADKPEILLVVRVHGKPGAHAARIAGQMLSRVQE
jgi:cell division protein FtsI/penicillin-binding protein 2